MSCGSAFSVFAGPVSSSQRRAVWLIGKIYKVKYFPSGVVEKADKQQGLTTGNYKI